MGCDPVEPLGEVPVGVAEEVHQRWHEHRAKDEGVHQYRATEADTELGDDALAPEGEGEEHADHDQGRGRDDAPGIGLTAVDGLFVAAVFSHSSCIRETKKTW